MCWKHCTGGKLDYTQWSSSHQQTNCSRLHLAAVLMCGTWILSHFFRDGHFLLRTALYLCFLPFDFPLSKPYRKNTHLALMVRNFLGQWKDKMLLPGPVAALGRQGNMLSPAYGCTKMLEDWMICLWSQVMSVARIKNQMFLTLRTIILPHLGTTKENVRASWRRELAQQDPRQSRMAPGEDFTYWATCSFFLPHCDMGYVLHRLSERVHQGREGHLLPRSKMQV